MLSFCPHCTGAALIPGADRAPYTSMHLPSRNISALRRQSCLDSLELLHTELALGLNLVGVAKLAHMAGYDQQSIEAAHYAKEVYSEVARCLASPKYAKDLSRKQRQGISASMGNLRKALNIVAKAAPKRLAVA